MWRSRASSTLVALLALVFGLAAAGLAPQQPTVLGLKDRDALRNRWLADWFQQVLPEVMRREQIDMWVVICREHNEDPVYRTLVPRPRTSRGGSRCSSTSTGARRGSSAWS